ncbi:precorrin-6A synthase (deacetylating) [Pelagimonas varians]|uniref:Precorrin-6A synthase [deacetylating] n=1 Tax=Pelagimonas varians TaxID=696760 RepID=A0A238K8Z4_9RHOB|nr:precorrin-6A synthase (deacetylating) [Pelagimonas varians]PYG31796.1 precorrin-6A synthase (deacetylating) [Pelagimonas varians]SMX38562.1 precorrin 6A synthase [Pelagimonas varians]
MIELLLVGVGAGNPKHLTLEAIEVLNSADLILIPRKGTGKDDLAELRRAICRDVLSDGGPRQHEFDLPVRDRSTPDYLKRVEDWHDAIADVWAENITAQAGPSGRVAFLVWGDPSLYDSTLRIAERVARKLPLQITVIPGITSVQALTAGHVIPVNGLGAPFTITTGRRLRDFGWPDGAETLVVMLDAGGAFEVLDGQHYDIWWSAFAGMPEEIRIAGRLSDVAAQIIDTRAAARADHGWIMDVYLIRKRP